MPSQTLLQAPIPTGPSRLWWRRQRRPVWWRRWLGWRGHGWRTGSVAAPEVARRLRRKEPRIAEAMDPTPTQHWVQAGAAGGRWAVGWQRRLGWRVYGWPLGSAAASVAACGLRRNGLREADGSIPPPTPLCVQAGAAGRRWVWLSSAAAASVAARSSAAPCVLQLALSCRLPQPPPPLPPKKLNPHPTPRLAALSGMRARLNGGEARTARSTVRKRAAAHAACSSGSVPGAAMGHVARTPLENVQSILCTTTAETPPGERPPQHLCSILLGVWVHHP